MKQIVLLAACLITAASLSAQNYTNKQFALIKYDVKITDAFRSDLQNLKDYISNAEVHNKNADDRLKALLIHHLYYNMTPMLEEKIQMSILPINSFMQKIKYDEFGYPRASISKALRKGDSPFYFKVEMVLDSKTEEKREKNPDLPGNITFPHYTIDITIYNNEGILPVDRWHGESKAKEPIKTNKQLFGSFTGQTTGSTDTTHQDLSTLHRQAVLDMLNSHLNE